MTDVEVRYGLAYDFNRPPSVGGLYTAVVESFRLDPGVKVYLFDHDCGPDCELRRDGVVVNQNDQGVTLVRPEGDFYHRHGEGCEG